MDADELKGDRLTDWIFVRHGETLDNASGVAQGWSDSELSPRGCQQVALLAERVRQLEPSALYSSTLPRAVMTARSISETIGLPVTELDELREMHCGRWEGVSFLSVRKDEPEFFEQWSSDPSLPCPDGESFRDVQQRLLRGFRLIETREKGQKGRIVIVAHGTAIRIAATILLNLPLDAARGFAQDNAAINLFERRGDRWVLKLWNDTIHCANA